MGRRRGRKSGENTGESRPEGYHRLAPHVLDDDQQEELRQTIAARVREARGQLGLTQRELADAFSKTQPWVAEIEAARQWPPHHVLGALSRATGRPLSWFYGREER